MKNICRAVEWCVHVKRHVKARQAHFGEAADDRQLWKAEAHIPR